MNAKTVTVVVVAIAGALVAQGLIKMTLGVDNPVRKFVEQGKLGA